MNISPLKSKLFSLIGGLSVAGLVLAGVVAAPTGTVLAQTATPPARPGLQSRGERLERWYQREQDWLDKQQQNLDRMNQIASKAQSYIANQQVRSKDVSALQTALAIFQQQIATAQSSHHTAANVLSHHAGYDANGKITNASQAQQTLIDGRQALSDAHLTMRQAVLDLRRAVRAWRVANGLTTSPTATPGS